MHRIIDIQISVGTQAYLYIGKKGVAKAYASEFSLPLFSCILYPRKCGQHLPPSFPGCQSKKNPLKGGAIFSSYTFLQSRKFLGSMEKSMIFYTPFFYCLVYYFSPQEEKTELLFLKSAENQFFMGVAFLQSGMAVPQNIIPALHKCILSVHSNFQYEDLSYACNLFSFAHLAVDRLILSLQILCPL